MKCIASDFVEYWVYCLFSIIRVLFVVSQVKIFVHYTSSSYVLLKLSEEALRRICDLENAYIIIIQRIIIMSKMISKYKIISY